MYIQFRFQYVYFVSTKKFKQNYQTLYFELAHNKVSFVYYFKLNHHTLLFCILYFVYVSYIAGQTAQKNWLKYFRKPVSILGSGGNIDLKIRNIFSSN